MSDRTLAVDPGSDLSWLRKKRLALTSGCLGAVGVALLAFSVVPQSTPNSEALRQQARAAAQATRWDEAEAALRQLRNPTPSDWLLRSLVGIERKDPETAVAYLRGASKDESLKVQVSLLSGRIELARFRAGKAEESLRQALRLDDKLVEARRLLVYLYGTQGRRSELLEQFSVLAEQSPLTFELLRHWCTAHQDRIRDPAELKPDLERFHENDTNDRYSRLGLAIVYRQLNFLDRSKAILEPLPDSDPDARACRAEIEFDRGNSAASAQLLADGPEKHAKLARLRGRLALNRGDGPAAVRFFRLSDSLEPNESETIYGLSRALRLSGDSAAAEPFARRVDAHRSLRDELSKTEDASEPKTILCCRMASLCESAGYLPEARGWYRLAISIDPFQEDAQRALFRLSASGVIPTTSNAATVSPIR
jgi:tetratricopeptide (TPR) repeat protein